MARPNLDLDRWDYGAARVLLGAAFLTVPALALGLPLAEWASGSELTWTTLVDAGAPVTEPDVRAGVEAVWDGSTAVTVAEPSTSLRLATLAPGLVVAVATALALGPLLRLVGSVQRGDSFSARAVTLLRVVAMTLLLAPWLYQVAHGIADAVVRDRAFGTGDSLSIAVDGTSLLISVMGMAVAVVAEAFRQGTRLRDDVDGLV